MNTEVAVNDGSDRALVHGLAAGQRQALHGTPSQAGVLDLSSLLKIVREWRWLILGAIAVFIAGAVIVTLLTRPTYRAWVTLEVSPPAIEILNEQSRESEAGAMWDQVATQVGLLTTRSLAERVAQDLNLAANAELVGTEGDAESRLRAATGIVAGGIGVEVPEEGRLIRYSFDAGSPAVAALIANGIADTFINSGLQRKFEASSYARNFLQKEIAKTRADLERSERSLVAYAQAQGIVNTSVGSNGQPNSDTGSLQGASLISLNQALAEATARRVMAEGAYRQAQLAGGTAEVNTSTQGLRQARAVLEAEYQDKRTLMKPEHPEMLSLRSRISELDRQVASERSQVTSGRVTTLLSDFRAASAAENSLRSQVASLKGSVLDLRGRSVRYNILQREVDTNRGLYDALLQRYKEIGVAGGVGTSPVSIVDRAEVPGGPFKPNLMLNLSIGVLLGLVFGLGAAIGLEILNDTIKTREDVRSKLGLACLGVIPKKRGKGAFADELEDHGSAVSEAYAAVLAALRFSGETGAPKTILITSANPSEGKSSTALAIAHSYARRGERVLLIDSDLRRPVFKGAAKNQGVTNLLTNEESIQGHVAKTQFDNLWLLPCGAIAPNPSDLLSTPRYGELLAEAGEIFERIVIDGPPVIGIADSSFLAAFARNVLLVVESGKTRTRAAREVIDRVHASGARIVGVTVTKSTVETSQYGYGYYRYGAVDDDRKEIIMISQNAES